MVTHHRLHVFLVFLKMKQRPVAARACRGPTLSDSFDANCEETRPQ